MIEARPIFRQARLTLQAESAHGIHSGHGDSLHDVLLVRDANGLPAIPGSSLAGVLRHAYARLHGAEAGDALFGMLGDEGHPSWLLVDWGLVHDANDEPCEGMIDPARIANDPILGFLQDDKPLVRQRVRLDHRGAAADTGKFDTTLIPAGARYTHWLGYWCDGSQASLERWERLLDLLGGPIRLGHGTRSGTGHFRTHALATASWDLRTAEGRAGYAQRPRLRREQHSLAPHASTAGVGPLEVRLQLQAEDGWRIGGGERSLSPHEREPDLVPQHEARIEWQGGKGRPGRQLHLLPGSAIKGALRHRVAYHYRRLGQEWAEASLAPTEQCPGVRQLFGNAEDDAGEAGILVFRDIQMPEASTRVLMHNRIDRFTGGVMRGALFSEEVLWQTPLTVSITVLDGHEVEPRAREALQCALEDLASGWLPLGAGGSRGLGTFQLVGGGAPEWSDNGAWIRSSHATSAQEAKA